LVKITKSKSLDVPGFGGSLKVTRCEILMQLDETYKVMSVSLGYLQQFWLYPRTLGECRPLPRRIWSGSRVWMWTLEDFEKLMASLSKDTSIVKFSRRPNQFFPEIRVKL